MGPILRNLPGKATIRQQLSRFYVLGDLSLPPEEEPGFPSPTGKSYAR